MAFEKRHDFDCLFLQRVADWWKAIKQFQNYHFLSRFLKIAVRKTVASRK